MNTIHYEYGGVIDNHQSIHIHPTIYRAIKHEVLVNQPVSHSSAGMVGFQILIQMEEWRSSFLMYVGVRSQEPDI